MNQLHTEPINRRTGIIDSLRLRQFCQLSPIRAVPSRAPARRAGVRRDCLKMNSAQMKTTEIDYLRKLVTDGLERPLSAADMRFLLRLRAALDDYDCELHFEPEASERRCGICGVPVSQYHC